jgi:hypothetical protein
MIRGCPLRNQMKTNRIPIQHHKLLPKSGCPRTTEQDQSWDGIACNENRRASCRIATIGDGEGGDRNPVAPANAHAVHQDREDKSTLRLPNGDEQANIGQVSHMETSASGEGPLPRTPMNCSRTSATVPPPKTAANDAGAGREVAMEIEREDDDERHEGKQDTAARAGHEHGCETDEQRREQATISRGVPDGSAAAPGDRAARQESAGCGRTAIQNTRGTRKLRLRTYRAEPSGTTATPRAARATDAVSRDHDCGKAE